VPQGSRLHRQPRKSARRHHADSFGYAIDGLGRLVLGIGRSGKAGRDSPWLIPNDVSWKSAPACLFGVDFFKTFSFGGQRRHRSVKAIEVAAKAQKARRRDAVRLRPHRHRADDMRGMWQRYYARWSEATRERLDPALLDLLPPLAGLCPPAIAINKNRYSAFAESELLAHLQARGVDGLIVTGSETDVCVLPTLPSSRSVTPCAVHPTKGTML
jgi:Isochorismatase family